MGLNTFQGYTFVKRDKDWEMYNLEKCSIMAEQMLTVTPEKIFIFFSFCP